MTGVPAPEARVLHILSIVSRSGKASAEILRIDIDEQDEELSQIADRAADAIYSRSGDAQRHAALTAALMEAIEAVEMIPGQPVSAEALLADGRRARAQRVISW